MNLGKKGIALKVVDDMYPYGNIVSKWLTIFVGKEVGLTPALTSSNADYYIYLYMAPYIFGIPDFYHELKSFSSEEKREEFIFQEAICIYYGDYEYQKDKVKVQPLSFDTSVLAH